MRFAQIGNKRDIVAVKVRNKDGSVAIKKGAPVYLALNGTDDGLAVKSVASLAAGEERHFFGIATKEIADDAFGEAQIFGIYDEVRIVKQTRAATTDAFASFAAGSTGQQLSAITLSTIQGLIPTNAVNGFGINGTKASTDTVGTVELAHAAHALLAESYASGASSASSTSLTELAVTAALKALIRAL